MVRFYNIIPLLAVISCAASEILIGELKTLQHDVSGKIYAKDDKTLVIYNFKYDGKGPDAFFWVGKTGNPKNTEDASTYILSEEGNYEYRDQSAPILGAYDGKDVTLTIPEGWKMNDIKWLSVWCRQFSVDFGNLIVAEGFKAPVAGEPGSPVPEPESEPEPEQEPEPIPDIDDNSISEPEAEPKSEPEPDNAGSTTLLVAPVLVLAALLL